VLSLAASRARAASVELSAAPGYLGSARESGGVLSVGAELGLATHLAAGFDFGYGLLDGAAGAQDRWWAMPSLAFVVPTERARFELGAGAGLGTASGYDSWAQYVAHPFTPIWHDTVPAAQVHALGALALTADAGLFARLDAGTLLGIPSSRAASTAWYGLSVGGWTRLF